MADDASSWSDQIRSLYLSGSANQFLLHGNVEDRVLLPKTKDGEARLGTLFDYLLEHQLRKFDVVFSYDLGHGLRVTTRSKTGKQAFQSWPSARDSRAFPKAPRDAIAYMDHFLRYCCNLRQLVNPEELTPEGRDAGGGFQAERAKFEHRVRHSHGIAGFAGSGGIGHELRGAFDGLAGAILVHGEPLFAAKPGRVPHRGEPERPSPAGGRKSSRGARCRPPAIARGAGNDAKTAGGRVSQRAKQIFRQVGVARGAFGRNHAQFGRIACQNSASRQGADR